MTADQAAGRSLAGVDALLRDGSIVHVRPVTADDRGSLLTLHDVASERSRYLRYFSLSRDAEEHYVDSLLAGRPDLLTLVAEQQGQVTAVATAALLGDPPDAAEIAFLVADPQQSHGVGTLLLEHLAAAVQARGVTRLVADTLPTNARMLDVFGAAGFTVRRSMADGVVRVELDLTPTARLLDAILRREAEADAQSLRRVLAPKSVAVIGAGRAETSIGGALLRNLLAGNFAGVVYPVNLRARSVAGVRAYPSVRDVPDDVDLAVVAVAAPAVLDVARDCAAKGVGGLLVLSAGFADDGPAGAELQGQLLAVCRAGGMRLLGPNCLGLINTAPDVRLVGTFAPLPPQALRPGRLGVLTQSGSLGAALVSEATRVGMGISTFLSIGNKADVSGNDLLLAWQDDRNTAAIALYLESFGNPRKFARIAPLVAVRKPILAIASGTTPAGGRAASRHTGGPEMPSDAVDALFRQTGVVRVDDVDQLVDVAQLLVDRPLPGGNRLAFVGNSGGPMVLAVDACAAAGLVPAELTEESWRTLAAGGVPTRGDADPVDLGTAATDADYARALRVVAADPGVDAVLVVHAALSRDRTAAALEQPTRLMPDVRAALADVPAAIALLGAGSVGYAPLPAYSSAERAVRAFGRAVAYARWRERRLAEPRGGITLSGGRVAPAARGLLTAVLSEDAAGRWLTEQETRELLAAGGLATRGAAIDADEAVSFRLAVVCDARFGALVRLGTSGPLGELLGDVVTRLTPIAAADADEFVRSLRSAPLLLGYGGRPPSDVAGLADLVARVAALADELPEVAEIVLDPVLVGPSGVGVPNARVRVSPAPPLPDPVLRRLR